MLLTKQQVVAAADKAFSHVDEMIEQLKKSPPSSGWAYAAALYNGAIVERERERVTHFTLEEGEGIIDRKLRKRAHWLKSWAEYIAHTEECEFEPHQISINGEAVAGSHIKGTAHRNLRGRINLIFHDTDTATSENLFHVVALQSFGLMAKSSFYLRLSEAIQKKLLQQTIKELGLEDEYQAYISVNHDTLAAEAAQIIAKRNQR